MKNSIEWKRIYHHSEVGLSYRGYGEETWECDYNGGKLVRHVRYDLNEGDESNHLHIMTFIPPSKD